MHSLWRQTHQNSSSCKDKALFFCLVRMYSEIEKTKDLFLFFLEICKTEKTPLVLRIFTRKEHKLVFWGGGETEFFRAPILNLESYVVFVHSPKLKTKAGGKSSLPGSYCNRAPASAFLTGNKQLTLTVMVDNYIVPAQQTRCSAELHKCALCLLHH